MFILQLLPTVNSAHREIPFLEFPANTFANKEGGVATTSVDVGRQPAGRETPGSPTSALVPASVGEQSGPGTVAHWLATLRSKGPCCGNFPFPQELHSGSVLKSPEMGRMNSYPHQVATLPTAFLCSLSCKAKALPTVFLCSLSCKAQKSLLFSPSTSHRGNRGLG